MNTSIILDKTDFKSIEKVLERYHDDDIVNIYSSKMDDIDKLIYKECLKIKAVHFHKDIDLMIIVLNNKKTFRRSISEFDRLKKAKIEQLNNYEFIGKGIGVHWPELDEDLSLRGFIKHEMLRSIQEESVTV